MKKLLSLLIALAILSAMTVWTAAADSPTNVTLVKSATIQGSNEPVTFGKAPTEIVNTVKEPTKLKDIIGNNYVDGMKAIAVREINIPASVTGSYTIEFAVSGIDSDTTGYIVHWFNGNDTGKFEVVPFTVVTASDGTLHISATLSSASPIAIVVDGETATAIEQVYGYDSSVDPKSPQTGDIGMVWIYVAAGLCILGSAAAFKASRKKVSVR